MCIGYPVKSGVNGLVCKSPRAISPLDLNRWMEAERGKKRRTKMIKKGRYADGGSVCEPASACCGPPEGRYLMISLENDSCNKNMMGNIFCTRQRIGSGSQKMGTKVGHSNCH